MSKNRPRAGLTSTVLAAAVAAGALTAAPAQAVTGNAAADGTFTFTARIAIGSSERACTGALIDPQWIVTAASCFADDPGQTSAVRAGKPAKNTTATIGRTDLTSTAGQVRTVVELAPRSDRDVVLARLDKPVAGIAPVKVSSTAPATGESLTVPGYGRTKTEWVPLKLHTGTFTVNAISSATLQVTGRNGAAVCAGDAGGPALRSTAGSYELVSVNSRSWQGGCFGQDPAETRTGAENVRLDDLGGWIDSVVDAARITDFNCDGVRDTAIADPDAAVGGDAGAGLVRVVYGGGKGTAELTQDLAAVPGGSEAKDRFGATLATYDHNLDGCTDLVVGAPAEDLGTATDAGMASILYGAPAGLTTGKAAVSLEQGSGTGALASMASEAGDQFGAALAAGTTLAGDPYLAVGAPGEDAAGGLGDAGGVVYVRGTGATNVLIHQDKSGVPGAMEAGDKFGSTIAGSPQHLVVGAPGEAIGTLAAAGGVSLFSHTLNADKLPTGVTGLDQDLDTVEGGAEADDRFGGSLALVQYRAGASANGTESILAVGSPGEDGSQAANAGRVDTFRLTATGFTQISGIYQGASGVPGATEAGDAFGQSLSAVNTAPGAVSTAQNTLLAVGVPGEDSTGATDGGTVYTFSLTNGAFISTVYPGKFGIPGALGNAQKVGTALHATGSELYLGLPNGPVSYGSAHAVPWANVLGGATQPVTTFQPGTGGLPAAGETFGSVIR
ncbi:S1 family peptidase [Streptomyces coeruleorubidus]|uniref:S1 family peptidase n=1 Tax=Streptomyces coeruleorubidus TaxID=116188 RepID=UPI00237EEC78|nr:S1 family peptidase [Streptomyces coeruleorubidus]WDV51098.1 S1 family peptidase [Streptomyces coeruleorubidus]